MLYEAWEQPSAGVDKNTLTTIQLRIAKDGSIVDASMQVGSGSKIMDESVLAALRKVSRLDPPPDGLLHGEFAVISIKFGLEG